MPGASSPLSLPSSRHVRLGRDFARIRNEGRRLVVGCLIMNWLPLSKDSVSRVGVVASKKVGGAVVRNRCRRWLREAFRLSQPCLENPVDMVLVARPSLAEKDFARVTQDFRTALRKANLEKGAA